MRPADDIKRFIDKAAVSTHPDADRIVLDTVLKAHEQTLDNPSVAAKPRLRSTVMRSPFTKFAAAAAVILAVVLSIAFWEKATPSAYALEQTLEANLGIRSLHIKNFTAGQDEPREGWLEFDEDGQVLRARASMPEWASPTDGSRVIVWRDGVVQMWLKARNTLAITQTDGVQEQLNTVIRELDPRKSLAHIAELEKQGQVEVTTKEPADRTKPIIVTVTYLTGSSHLGRRSVLSVDRATKLVSAIELYELRDGDYQHEGTIELHEYNQPIDARVFDLTNEVPADTARLDLSATRLGLAQGPLSDEAVAIEVVRQFFEALMARDYGAANRFLPLGAAALKQQFDSVKVLRIVSVGPATRGPEPQTGAITVPCTIEIEENSQKKSITLSGIKVHRLGGQPDQWAIQGLGN